MNTTGKAQRVSRRVPVWLRVTLLVVAAVILLGLAAPFFMEVDRYRTVIAAAVEREAGRKLTLGKMHAKLLPSPGLVVEDARLGNPAGFPEGDFLTIEKMQVNASWGSALGNVHVNSVELVRPKVALLSDGHGRTNYDFVGHGGKNVDTTIGADGNGPGARSAASRASSSFTLEQVDRILLKDGAVSLGEFRGRTEAAPSARITGLNLKVGNLSLGPNAMKQLNGDVDLTGLKAQIAELGSPLEFKSGHLKLENGAARGEFLARLGKAAEVKGTLQIADLLKPVTEFELSTGQLNVDDLVTATTPPEKKIVAAHSPAGRATGGETTGASARTRAEAAPAPQHTGVSELVAQGKITAERIRFNPYTANNGLVEVRIFTDRIEAWPVQMQLYGGALQVSARGDRRQDPIRFSANVKINNFDVGKFVSVNAETKGKITGTGDLNLQLIGTAGDQLIDSLSGTGTFVLRDGVLPGINLPGALGALANFQGQRNSSTTPYRVIQGDLTIARKRVASKQIHVDSPEGIVDMRGSFGFDKTIEYQGQAKLAGGGASPVGLAATVLGAAMGAHIKSATIPFSVRGTFSSPKLAAGRGMPQFETSGPSANGPKSGQAPQNLQDALKGLFKKP
ncbi:MAG TPA: AsmA family protein [Candidatus Dormibacteraeota bacterium]|nr:AsmA family protein [Candidatus Dormibacteraeota bacterium]